MLLELRKDQLKYSLRKLCLKIMSQHAGQAKLVIHKSK